MAHHKNSLATYIKNLELSNVVLEVFVTDPLSDQCYLHPYGWSLLAGVTINRGLNPFEVKSVQRPFKVVAKCDKDRQNDGKRMQKYLLH